MRTRTCLPVGCWYFTSTHHASCNLPPLSFHFRSLTLIGTGVAIGLAGAAGTVRLMRGLLYGVTPSDPLTFAAVSALLALVAAVAASVPGLRATRVDPVIALREIAEDPNAPHADARHADAQHAAAKKNAA